MRTIAFDKFHALGNDFIVVDLGKVRLSEAQKSEITHRICDRRSGVGADGVLYLSRSRGRFMMRIFNADGSEAELSGNGLRILAHYLVRTRATRQKSFAIYSIAGRNDVTIHGRKGQSLDSSVQLPAPVFETKRVPMRVKSRYFISSPFTCEAGELIGTAVNVGNPHLVFFVDSFDFDWRVLGSIVETDRRFPQNTNVEFAHIKSRRSAEHRIWERGAGETSASGSGAAAVAAAGIVNGLLDHEVTVHEPAGELKISIPSLEGQITVTGPTAFIAHGSFIFESNR